MSLVAKKLGVKTCHLGDSLPDHEKRIADKPEVARPANTLLLQHKAFDLLWKATSVLTIRQSTDQASALIHAEGGRRGIAKS